MEEATPDQRRLLDPVAAAYDERLQAFGLHHRAVAWADEEGMLRRFQVFVDLLAGAAGPVDVNDHGCGYGGLFEALRGLPALGRYSGTDVSPAMIQAARALHDDPRAAFHVSHVPVTDADYTFASGTYSLRLDAHGADWEALVFDNLRAVWARTRACLSFNMLCGPDPLPTLHHFDPEAVLAFCRGELGAEARVEPLGPREFAIVARRRG